MFPRQEPWVRGPPLKHLVQIFRGGSSYSRYLKKKLMREHSKYHRKKPPFPGGFSIYYVPWSRAVCKRFHDEMRPSHLVVESLTHGSWSVKLVNRKLPRGGNFFRWNRKPPRGGGFLSINIPLLCRDVTSHKEWWEGNRNSHSHNSDTVMGIGREPGIFLSAGNLFFEDRQRIAEGICEDCWRIFWVFRSSKTKLFLDGQFKLLWHWPLPLYFDIENHLFFHKKLSLMVIVNIKVYKRNIWNVTMWHVCRYL